MAGQHTHSTKTMLLEFLVLALFAHVAFAQLPASYQCDAAACVPPACRCASVTPPVTNPPQFLLLTFDDSIQEDLYATAMSLLNYKNPNGCSARATWYAQVFYTDPALAQRWYALGHEIADHSVTHVTPFAGSVQEMRGMLEYFTTYAGIPRGKISGVRFPFRNYTQQSIEDLKNVLNFTYESSMANSDNDPVWPYTMDFGVVSDCINSPNLCTTANLNAKGLWELPMAQSVGTTSHLMDPFNDPVITEPITPDQAVEALTASFNKRYTGNRAPFGLYLHPIWYGKAQPSIPDGTAKLDGANKFLAAAMANPDVWMVTGQQVIEYMKNPVPASELGTQPYMQCPTPPSGICNGRTPTLEETCNLTNGTIHSCFGCPTTYPTLENPNPERVSTTKCLVPNNCDGVYWDPIGCKCLCESGACSYSEPSPSPTSSNSSGGTTSSNSPSSSNSNTSAAVLQRKWGLMTTGLALLSLLFFYC